MPCVRAGLVRAAYRSQRRFENLQAFVDLTASKLKSTLDKPSRCLYAKGRGDRFVERRRACVAEVSAKVKLSKSIAAVAK